MTTRREALIWTAAAAAAASWQGALAAAEFGAARYSAAMVIDALGSPGDFDANAAEDAPLSAHALSDVKASGITAVNVTVNIPGNAPDRFERAVDAMAGMEHEIAVHPDVFIKVLRSSDLGQGKVHGQEWASSSVFKTPVCWRGT